MGGGGSIGWFQRKSHPVHYDSSLLAPPPSPRGCAGFTGQIPLSERRQGGRHLWKCVCSWFLLDTGWIQNSCVIRRPKSDRLYIQSQRLPSSWDRLWAGPSLPAPPGLWVSGGRKSRAVGQCGWSPGPRTTFSVTFPVGFTIRTALGTHYSLVKHQRCWLLKTHVRQRQQRTDTV